MKYKYVFPQTFLVTFAVEILTRLHNILLTKTFVET